MGRFDQKYSFLLRAFHHSPEQLSKWVSKLHKLFNDRSIFSKGGGVIRVLHEF